MFVRSVINQSSMATLVKVYGPPLSTAVCRVLACLHEKEVEYELISLNILKGEHKNPEFLKLQPFGQVPVFQDESITLFESRAISRYICDKYADKGNNNLYGTNPLAKASIDQWLEVEGQSFHQPSLNLAVQLAYVPKAKLTQDTELIKQSEEKLVKVLDVYEQRLGESRFLAGDDFSLADLSHLPNIQYLMNGTDMGDLFTSRKNVGRWWLEMSSRDSWNKVVDMQKITIPV